MLLWLKYPAAHKASTCRAEISAAGWKTPRIAVDSGLFTVRAATQTIHMAGAAQQSGVRASPVQVRLGDGVGPPFVMRPQPPCVPLRILLPPRLSCAGTTSRNHDRLGVRIRHRFTSNVLAGRFLRHNSLLCGASVRDALATVGCTKPSCGHGKVVGPKLVRCLGDRLKGRHFP